MSIFYGVLVPVRASLLDISRYSWSYASFTFCFSSVPKTSLPRTIIERIGSDETYFQLRTVVVARFSDGILLEGKHRSSEHLHMCHSPTESVKYSHCEARCGEDRAGLLTRAASVLFLFVFLYKFAPLSPSDAALSRHCCQIRAHDVTIELVELSRSCSFGC